MRPGLWHGCYNTPRHYTDDYNSVCGSGTNSDSCDSSKDCLYYGCGCKNWGWFVTVCYTGMYLFFFLFPLVCCNFFFKGNTKAMLQVAGEVLRYNPMIIWASLLVSLVWVGFSVMWLEMWRKYCMVFTISCPNLLALPLHVES